MGQQLTNSDSSVGAPSTVGARLAIGVALATTFLCLFSAAVSIWALTGDDITAPNVAIHRGIALAGFVLWLIPLAVLGIWRAYPWRTLAVLSLVIAVDLVLVQIPEESADGFGSWGDVPSPLLGLGLILPLLWGSLRSVVTGRQSTD